MMIIRLSIAKAHDSVFNRASVHTLNVLYIYVFISVYIYIYIYYSSERITECSELTLRCKKEEGPCASVDNIGGRQDWYSLMTFGGFWEVGG